ncbi:TolC family protein [Desulforegula conservatrix]|uniref:TolC family protein n=1 Tax=Desulforegula conservatrix TaxID=153026 RepID=UPI00042829FF|nr:TolC family protein [Desulforegula conservatrix]
MNEIETRAKENKAHLFEKQEPLINPLSLEEAIARALKYNLDYRAGLFETALAKSDLTISHFDMLPEIVSSAGYSHRNNESGGSSIYLSGPFAGTKSLTSTGSEEKDKRTSSIGLTWNVLDFGLSYVRAKQYADSVLVIEERRRKASQNLVQDVRFAYFKAAGAEMLSGKLKSLLEKCEVALSKYSKASEDRNVSLDESLVYQQTLLENIRLLKELMQKLSTSEIELATLINQPPGTNINFPDIDWDNTDDLTLDIPVKDIEELAFVYRPELREDEYRLRISAQEAKKAMLGMLPGINIYGGYYYDSNDFLYNNTWLNAGTQASLNLFNIFSGFNKLDAAEIKESMTRMMIKAKSMAVISQVNLSVQKYLIAKDEFNICKRLNSVSERLAARKEAEYKAGRIGELAALLPMMTSMVNSVRHILAFADLQNSVGRVINSTGIDLYNDKIEEKSLYDIAGSTYDNYKGWTMIKKYSINSYRIKP